MPIEIRELEILAEPRSEASGPEDPRADRRPEPGAGQVERNLLAWHREMILRADRLRAD